MFCGMFEWKKPSFDGFSCVCPEKRYRRVACRSVRDVQIETACDHPDKVGDFFQRFDIEGVRVEYIRLELRDDLPILHVAVFPAVEKTLQGGEIPVGRHRQFLAVRDGFRQELLDDDGENFPVVFQKWSDPFGFFDFQDDREGRDTLFGRFMRILHVKGEMIGVKRVTASTLTQNACLGDNTVRFYPFFLPDGIIGRQFRCVVCPIRWQNPMFLLPAFFFTGDIVSCTIAFR